ncbi:hypothetical protein BDK51DRAFT_31444 [Blyttiomyces helicus]|uniref:Pre-rRNA-processing protein n=1 Tax=Blyttiomyces helicus TaxID=388810 RepID=A0A4P9WDW2_9FUNG|nr:hypothetical protein BDK51DRAFT_31444 [Blyttiomyces helicus]|eukprot:RKO90901.1 hypothetical protein BDK51DRAFT_31444 [Blyttiomyces helicus]
MGMMGGTGRNSGAETSGVGLPEMRGGAWGGEGSVGGLSILIYPGTMVPSRLILTFIEALPDAITSAMPKATRKKKQKAEDFKKPKLKVGKKLAAPTNQTDVTFKTQAVVVPNQSITSEKPSSELVNSRNRTLKELMVQVRHYAAQTRKEAIIGIRDLYNKHPEALHTNLSLVLEGLTRLIVDEDSFRPFVALVMAYTSSAMTHITEDIRLDGLKFLGVWLQYYPTLVTPFADKHWQWVEERLVYRQWIISHQSVESTRVFKDTGFLEALASRSNVLRLTRQRGMTYGLTQPLVHLIRESAIWGILRSGAFEGQSGNVVDLFGATGASVSDRLSMGPAQGLEKSGSNAIRNTYDLQDMAQLKALIDIIMPIMVDFWLESSATVFSASAIGMSPALSTLHTVLKMMSLLWRAMLGDEKNHPDREWVENWGKTILKYFNVHFPFGGGNFSIRDDAVESVLQEMNILFCELLSHFILVGGEEVLSNKTRWRERLLAYLLDTFNGTVPKDGGPRMVHNMRPEHLEATFPVVWTVLNRSQTAERGQLFHALATFQETAPPILSMRSMNLISRILMIQNHRQYTGKFRIGTDDCMGETVRKMLLSLPRRLWELRVSNDAFSRDILRTLAFCLRENTCGVALDKAFTDDLAAKITTFFQVTTSRGSVFGPFIDVPAATQRAAIDCIFHLPSWPQKLVAGIVACCGSPKAPADTVAYILEAMDHRQRHATTALPPPMYASVLATVAIVGYSAAEIEAFGALGGAIDTTGGILVKRSGVKADAKGKRAESSVDEQNALWDRRTCIVDANPLPLDAYYGIARSFHTIGSEDARMDASLLAAIDSSLPAASVSALTLCFALGSAHEVGRVFRRSTHRAFRRCMDVTVRLLELFPAMRGAVLRDVASRAIFSPPSAQFTRSFTNQTNPDVTSTIASSVKVATRVNLNASAHAGHPAGSLAREIGVLERVPADAVGERLDTLAVAAGFQGPQ